ncbi:MAG: pyridoxal-phosphate dependent enzyme [Kofleriaceae bacterium]|jgi:1-aminocyclopropane-1-carboxylate deaminase/D-cysteine desulfhydrase-like pyridoxal-dependent ACC family enzyme|nr:pyridoxal-phosphate dependent enzyme [Kofleriaceae bacterium]MBP9171614.1 pyridoxal-phosphate dependent enzyme [Kofleriaceae bacterium]MBP9858953.1 pyridoxal-phosphate dependent enzyme [Kofleriaceae bacterium]
MTSAAAPALHAAVPRLAAGVPWVGLGAWPTPIEPLGEDLWVKREDRTAPRYGGNKVRTLEAMLGRARAAGATRIWATGAYGSNHVLATAIHAAAAGLACGAIVFPQPATEPAVANARAIVATGAELVTIPTVALLPLAMAAVRRRRGAYVMPPGGATAEGAMGALAAAFELAAQHRAGAAPWPVALVLPVGSGCTTAGLLAGLHLAHRLGFAPTPPLVWAARVTPWPITSRWRLARLAAEAVDLAERHLGAPTGITEAQLRASLVVDGRYLGAGYGHATAAGEAAARRLAAHGLHADQVYAAKAAAALFDLAPRAPGPVLFWLTKSSAPLVLADAATVASAPRRLRRWIEA